MKLLDFFAIFFIGLCVCVCKESLLTLKALKVIKIILNYRGNNCATWAGPTENLSLNGTSARKLQELVLLLLEALPCAG